MSSKESGYQLFGAMAGSERCSRLLSKGALPGSVHSGWYYLAQGKTAAHKNHDETARQFQKVNGHVHERRGRDRVLSQTSNSGKGYRGSFESGQDFLHINRFRPDWTEEKTTLNSADAEACHEK